jgi:hypothetical protein
MKTKLHLEILAQPDETTCGPTGLHALYRYYGDDIPLAKVIDGVPALPGGGTLSVLMACHALRRGYHATIFTYELQLFDPTWFVPGGPDIRERLAAQMAVKDDPKLRLASRAYIEFLELGGKLRFEDLTKALIRGYLRRSIPIITGLSATYLYGTAREFGPGDEYDDVRGSPAGHFVVLCGYDRENRTVIVADPLHSNPVGKGPYYEVDLNRVLCSILLGVTTYDANLLIIRPMEERKGGPSADAHRR